MNPGRVGAAGTRQQISGQEFAALLLGVRESAFRVEALPTYIVPEEEEALAAFRRGDPLPPPPSPGMIEWGGIVKRVVASGARMERVHVLPPKLTDYLRFEIEWGYATGTSAGEDIRLLPADAAAELGGRVTYEFWLFDDQTLVPVLYDDDGRFLGFTTESDPTIVNGAIALKGDLLRRAIPLRQYLRKLRGLV